MLIVLGFTAGFVLARHAVQLDEVVRERFAGRLFRVPSRVYSAPTILYPGLDWKQIDLRGTLIRLGYREAENPGGLLLARFHWKGPRLLLHRRAFEHPTRAEPALLVAITLEGNAIAELRDLATRRELGALLLEPELVGAYYGPQHEQRELVQVAQLPRYVVDAVLAVEDKRFLDHHGIDYRRIVGAFLANVRAGGIREGGSTLTMQLAKNFFLTPDRTLSRWAEQTLMAIIMEARYEKELILEAYLNEIYLGQRGSTAIHGMGEAARLYFGKNLAQLDIHEVALLAGMIQSPNGLSPHKSPEKAKARRDLVLKLMREQDRMDEETYQHELAQPLQVAAITPEPREGRYFLDALRRQLPEFYAAETLTTDGLRIYSTLDVRIQRAAVKAVREELGRLEQAYPRLAQKGGQRLQACLLAMRPQTGEVVALVGGRDYAKSQYDRCTQARRQVGSVFKPFVYVTALEPTRGGSSEITLASWVADEPLSVKIPGGTWSPKNFDRTFHGRVPVRTALEKSFNAAAAGLAQRVGIRRLIETARRLGVESPLPEVPSLALGSAELTPVELARAYATLANGGMRPRVRNFEDVVDPRGGAVEREPIAFQRVLDSGTAYLATSLLQGVVDRGTAAAIRRWGLVGPIAGKTGTSNDEKDAWFVGFTPELVAVVWVGYDEPKSLGLASAQVALPVWAHFLKEVTGGHVRGAFVRPGDVVELEIEPETGAIALAGCPTRRSEYFLRGTEPAETCPRFDAPYAEIERDEPERGREREPDRPREPSWIERLFDGWLDGR